MNSAKLYVGNLSYETSEASIRTAFEAHGEVTSVNLITDRDTGRPKGFGFVEMGSAEEAQKAKSALDGTQLDGRALKVDVAKERRPARLVLVATAVAAATVAAAASAAVAAVAATVAAAGTAGSSHARRQPAGSSRALRELTKRRPSGRRFCLVK